MGHTLAATTGFLALYQEIQEELVKEIKTLEAKSISPVGHLISLRTSKNLICQSDVQSYSNFVHYDKILACFLESGRLFRKRFV